MRGAKSLQRGLCGSRDGDYRPAEEVYDVDAQHAGGGGNAAQQEFAGLLTTEFAECLFQP